ncbi:unnamed protein product [Acanthoscelides obtectus]|uniref:Uncharacterized protein n=1 Tax=Acanthoscelides obtectus TaxID=200917 RepID=A0A9P0LIA3_ACAOB|nr:unnamed protein product [Acanthoscelides obtectus]CAK1624138.1 hypothetical protein AOBTE_LOCUS2344 [Acanthoscelides obtectus]
MEKDTINYMQYKMGFRKKILLTEDAVPTKFHCQEDRKRPLSDAGLSRGAYVKRKRMDLVNTCLQSQNATEAQAESLQKDESLIQDIIEPQGLSRTQDRETITNSIITAEKSVQVTIKENVHHRSKSVQTRCQTTSISTSPMKVSTTSRSTSPFKIKPCSLRPPQSEIVKAVKRNVFLEDEKSDSDISCIESGRHLSPFVTKSASSSSGLTDSDSNVTDANENIEKLECLKITMRSISKKPMMYVGIPKECYFLIKLLHKHTSIKVEHILLCLKKIRMNSTFSELEDNFGISLSYARYHKYYSFEEGLYVVATVSDQGTTNRAALKALCAENRDRPSPYNSVVNGQKIVTICDVPHLLKNTRNALISNGIEFERGKIARFKYIEGAYNLDQEKRTYRMLPKLRPEYFNFQNTL